MSATTALLSVLGTGAMTHALKTGKGGPIQAIDSLKCLFSLLLDISVKKNNPNSKQVLGIACAIIGAVIISTQGK